MIAGLRLRHGRPVHCGRKFVQPANSAITMAITAARANRTPVECRRGPGLGAAITINLH